MRRSMVIFLLVFALTSFADYPPIIPVKDVKVGMKGYAVTVFQGYKPQRFDVEVLGVEYWWIGLRCEPVITIKATGGPKEYPIEKVGLAHGMSGSPVYLYTKDGIKLLGAFAYKGQFDKDQIGWVTPAEVMIKYAQEKVAKEKNILNRKMRISIAGPFKIPTAMKNEFEKRGFVLERYSAMTNKTNTNVEKKEYIDTRKLLKPGASITAYLVTGDIEFWANGTVTAVDKENGTFLAFGHPFTGMGNVNFPVKISFVEAVVSNYRASYKIISSESIPLDAAITYDSYGIKGVIGKKPEMIPVKYNLKYQKDERVINVQVAKTKTSDWLILLLSFYTINGGYDEFQLERFEKGYITIDINLKTDIRDFTFRLKDEFTSKNRSSVFLDEMWGFYKHILRPLSIKNINIRAITFEVKYQTDNPKKVLLDNAYLNSITAAPGDSIHLTIIFKSNGSPDSLLKYYKTIYDIQIPVTADTGYAEIQVKTGDLIIWQTESEKISTEKLIQRLKTYSDEVFIKVDVPLVYPDSMFTDTAATKIIIRGTTKWKQTTKRKPIKKFQTSIIKIELPTEIENAVIDANAVLQLRIISKGRIKDGKKHKNFFQKYFGWLPFI